MTIPNQTSSVTLTGNGVTTVWDYNFIIPDAESASVGLFDISLNNLTILNPSEYNITGLNDPNGGTVTYPLSGDPLSSNFRITISRLVEYEQSTIITNQTPFYPKVLERQLDRIVMQIQQLAEQLARSIKVTLGSTLTPDEFVSDLQEGAAVAQQAAAAAQLSAEAAATSAALTELPAMINALEYLRRNAANTAYEALTASQMRLDIEASKTAITQAKSANYTVTAADDNSVVIVNASGAARTITLPAAASVGNGFRVIIKKSDSSANTVTVDGNGSETIDGALTHVLRFPGQSVALICDGTAWHVMSAGSIFASGTNANGDWIRFADGTQFCSRITSVSVAMTTTWGSLFVSDNVSIGDYAMPFIAQPVIQVASAQNVVAITLPLGNHTTTSFGQVSMARPITTAAATRNIHAFAYGKWF